PIGLGDVGAAKGQTTQALLTIRNASAIGAGSLDLTYDPAVVTVDAVDLASPWTGASNIDNANGKARMNYFTAYGQSGDVPICTITFRATGEPGDTSPLNVDVTELVNANGQDITFAALPVPGEFQVLYPNTPDPFRYRDAANLYKGILSGNTLYFGEEGLNLTRLGNVQHLVHYSNFSAGTVDAVIDVPDCRSFDLVARGSPIPGRYYARGDDGLLNGRPWIEIREPCTGLDVLLAGTNTSVNGVTLTDNVTLDFALENNLEGLHTLPAAALMDIEVTTPGGGKLTQFGGVDMRDIPINVSTVYARGVSLNDTDPGSYIARAVWSSASDFAGKGYDSNTVSFEIIRSTIPPAASFMANVTIGTIPLAVAFTDTSTGNVTSWAWDFGDGNTSTDQNPTHTYTAAGTYTVSLNASNAGGSSTETKTDYITVLEPPAAAFTAIPTEGNAPLAVQFTDQSTGNVTAWRWSFGDGSASTDQDPTHTYATAGTYTVSLNASNAYRYSISAPAMITVLEPPTAAFTANVTGGKVPLTVQFTDQSTGNVTAWHWSFGDDTTSTEQSPIHTYRAPGTYTISLNASNAGSSSTETKTDYITVIVPPPVATFTTSVTEGNAPLTIRFTDTSTGEITAWRWSFGDGATATTRNSTHTYAEVGTYTARLTITGPGGNDAAERIITVTPPATGAAFTANVTAGLAPLAVQFTDTSSNSPTSWSWTFGDGATSTEQHPVHTYTLPGNHTVTLSVNGGAETCTKPGYIKVTPVLFGDANEDGAINQADTLIVLQEVVGLREKPAADTNRFRKTDTHANGVIEVADALFIAQYNVGLRDVWFAVL
ncbi:MAG: PKD domain-containing protein, partial [Methanoculleus sp.]|nr:PKD domain-containing protein [Methanoculleus sp.]